MREISRRNFLKGAAVSAAAAATVSTGIVSFAEEEAQEESYEIAETLECDAVVLGIGAAGLMGAIALAEQGVNTIVCEKAYVGSSNGSMAGGPALAETDRQAQIAEDEGDETALVSIKQLFDYEYEFSHCTVNGNLLHSCIEQGNRVYHYFADNGTYVSLRKDAYGLGFRARHGFVDPELGNQRGAARFQPVADKIVELGATILEETKGVKILMEDGAVCGVIVYNSDEEVYKQINCKAVMVACGGYLDSPARLAEHYGDLPVYPLGTGLCDGTGYDMVLAAGGCADRNWGLCCNEFGGATAVATRNTNNSPNLVYAVYGGLMVNKDGKRFCNEAYLANDALSIGGEAALREGIYYAVLDQEAFDGYAQENGMFTYYGSPEEWWTGKNSTNRAAITVDGELVTNADRIDEDIANGWAYKADTLEEIAEYFNIPELPEAVAEYNASCEAGVDEKFNKPSYLMKALSTPPYYVFQYYASAWTTFGGVKTDEKCNCVNTSMEKIPGLYAVGVDNGSLYTNPYYSNEGACFGLALGSGCVAADAIAEYLNA